MLVGGLAASGDAQESAMALKRIKNVLAAHACKPKEWSGYVGGSGWGKVAKETK